MNRFELAHLQGRGSLTQAQEKFLISQPPGTLAKYRQELGIFGPIPKLSKKQAWWLIRRITQAQGAGNG